MADSGQRNLISDVSGVLVGHAHDEDVASGVTVLRFSEPMTAAVDVRGGGPGTRETDVLAPENLVSDINALVFSGGSVFGLGAADTVAAALSHHGVGLRLTDSGPCVPIVPAAVLHDLGNDGDKEWAGQPPYGRLGASALAEVSEEFALGSVGAGRGASAGVERGGLGSASIDLGNDIIVGALAVVNSLGTVRMSDGETFLAWPYELDGEFGGRRPPADLVLHNDPFPDMSRLSNAGRIMPGANTTLAIVATSLDLSATELKRIAMMAHDGMARAIRPAHTPFDGDVVFAVSSAACETQGDAMARSMQIARIGSAAADSLARAIARGVYAVHHSSSAS